MKQQLKRVSDLTPHKRNANTGTERGRQMLEDSLRQYGAGRGVLIDKNGVVIAGNHVVEEAVAVGINKLRVVPTDGTEIVAVQRTDLDIDKDPQAVALALADNRVQQVNFNIDAAVIARVAVEVDLSKLWTPKELEQMQRANVATKEETVLLDQAVQLKPDQEYIVVVCDSAQEFETLKGKLGLGAVRRGGYKRGTAYDAVGLERVIPAKRVIARLK